VDDFQICLYPVKGGDPILSIAEIAALPREARGLSRFDYEYTEFRWTIDDVHREYGSFLPLYVIVWQLGPTGERVAAGQRALLRAGADDTIEGVYWLFEPAADERVSVFVLSTQDGPHSYLSPIPSDGAEAQQLYAFVERERSRLIRDGNASFEFEPFTVRRDALVAALERNDAIGRALLSELGGRYQL
jgi:hypothetical protein